MFKQKKIYIVPIIGFLLTIFIISIIFELPFCRTKEIKFIDLLYEATSLVTATGSNVVNISKNFTFVGQLVMLFAMQVGAIGFMIFFSILFTVSKKKLKLSDAIFLSNEINTNNYTTIRFQAKRITRYTIIIEILGTWLLAFRFIPMFGLKTGIWYSIFHSVSAFCNVGADIVENTGFSVFRNDLYINIVFIILMFLGSLGFFVLEDIVHCFAYGKKNKISVQSKLGGGPGSNAGGIRIMVFVILILTTWANIRERDDVVVYYRSINERTIRKAISVFNIDLFIVFGGLLGLVLSENKSVIDTLFYTVSEFSNTGLTTLNLSELSTIGKLISIIVMYAGRIAPFSFTSLFIQTDRKNNVIKYPNIDVIL